MVNRHPLPLTHGLAVLGRRLGKGLGSVLCGLVLAFAAGVWMGSSPVPALANVIEVESGTYPVTESADAEHTYILGAGTQLAIVSSSVYEVAGISGEGDLVVNYTDTGMFFLPSLFTGDGDNFTYTGYTILQNGTLVMAGAVPSTAGLIQYGGTTVLDQSETYGGIQPTWKSYTLISNNGRQAVYEGDLIVRDGTLNFMISSLLEKYTPETADDEGGVQSGAFLVVAGSADLTNSVVNVQVDGDIELPAGTTLHLLQSDNLTYMGDQTPPTATIQTGSTILTTTAQNVLYNDGLSLYLTIYPDSTHSEAMPGTKALNSSALTGLMLTLQGADLVATRGMQAAVEAAREAEDVVFTPFATMSGSSMHYKGTSESWLSSYNLMTGFVLGRQTDIGRLVAGAFFEYGTGSYSTDNSFGSHTRSGDGNAYYLGAGLLARMDFADLGSGHFYLEASGRLGGLHNSYGNDGLRDGNGVRAEYDSYAPYYSFHVGLGYIWDISEENTLELYGKYLWTRECGESVTLSTKETVDFDDIDSSRLRFGARFAYTGSEYVRPYVGVAWEHEFDGVASSTSRSATATNVAIPQANLRGDTGIGEIGITISPSKDVPLNVDLGVTGYTGKREGVAGTLLLTLTF